MLSKIEFMHYAYVYIKIETSSDCKLFAEENIRYFRRELYYYVHYIDN